MGLNGPTVPWGYVIPPTLSFLVLLGLALISLLRGAKKQTNLLFAAVCFLVSLLNANVAVIAFLPDEVLAGNIDRFVHTLFVFSVPIYIRFIHSFLGIRTRRLIEYLAWLFSLVLVPIVPTDLYLNGFHHYAFGRIGRAGILFHVFSAAVTFTVLYGLILLYRVMRQTTDNLQKNRIKYIFGGMGFAGLLLALTILPISGVPIYPPGNFSFIPAVFLAFGVLKYDLLDIGVLIRRGTVYFLLTCILTLLYVLVIFLFHGLFLTSTGGDSLVLSLILSLIIVLLFNPLNERVHGLIDRLLFRGRYDYRRLLREISGRMASLLSLPQIRTLLIVSISEALQVEGVSLVIQQGRRYRIYQRGEDELGVEGPEQIDLLMGLLKGSRTPLRREVLERIVKDDPHNKIYVGLMNSMAAALAIPLPSPEGLVGMIVLGQKKSGELFVDEDLELLTTIANQAATAIENARSYEALELLNRDLEKKVAERTTALRKALAEKEKTQEQLIRSESLAAIGQLVAGTAHELNNPIAGAMSLLESSLEAIEGSGGVLSNSEEVLDDLRFSVGELRRASAIIRSLLDLSRQTQTYVEPVDINRALDDALRVLHNQYKHLPVVIEKDYDTVLPFVEGNFANLGQVLINIIRNAVQALPEGKGRIRLVTRYDETSDVIRIVCTDNGTGVSAKYLKDIFKPFFTTKPVGRGTGLGLYICHEIIRRHNGQIHVESQEGVGTTMTIELPCRRKQP